MRLYKEGDIVKVWSLQSFFHGGFIKGKEAIVSQDQLCEDDTVIVTVERVIDGELKIDSSYEVYPQQLRLVQKIRGGKNVIEFRLLIQKLKEKRKS